MCLTEAGRITAITPDAALIDVGGRELRASRALVPEAVVDDWVTVGMGWVLARISQAEAREIAALQRAIDSAPMSGGTVP